MKLRTSGSLPLSKAISGFLQYKAAEGLSPNTISSYEHDLKLWLEFTTDQPVHWIKTQQLNEYFVWLRTTYVPRRITGNQQVLSPKTIHNFYISLSAFFTWACREFNLDNPIKAVPKPKFEEKPFEPFTKEQVEVLLKACPWSLSCSSASVFGWLSTVVDARWQPALKLWLKHLKIGMPPPARCVWSWVQPSD